MTSVSSAHRTQQTPPLARGSKTRSESVPDPIAELRSMVAGQSRLLPTMAHAEAAVAHIDQLIACVAEREQTIQDVLTDWLTERMRARALESELARKGGI